MHVAVAMRVWKCMQGHVRVSMRQGDWLRRKSVFRKP